MADWFATFQRLVHHVRACGWTCPFVLSGERFMPIGMTSPGAGRAHHNDNRKPT